MIADSTKQQALGFIAAGVPIKVVARQMGVSVTALKSWRDPQFAERRRQSRERSIANQSQLFCDRLAAERREARKRLGLI